MRFVIGFLSLVVCWGCPLVSATSPVAAEDFLHLEWRDTRVSPGQDFFTYANGTWQKQNPIPSDHASWGTFYILHEKMQAILHQMLVKAANNPEKKPGSIEQKVGDFYFSGMDEASINAFGLKPLAPEMSEIANIHTVQDLQTTISHLQREGVNVVFNFGSMQDFSNSQKVIGVAQQGGLGLPDRDYYLKKETKFETIRSAYRAHIAKMFELAGESPSTALSSAKVVMHIETAMARASLSQIEQRDPHAIYHLMSLQQLEQVTPGFSWSDYFSTLGYPRITRINLAMPVFFKQWDKLLTSVSLNDWRTYLRWHVLDDYAPYLSTPFVLENFKMNAALTGTKTILPRWQRVVSAENGALGFAIGKLYVDAYFPPSSKAAVLDILHHIHKALERDLSTLSWMTPATRKAALKKLSLMGERVGYPDKWWDYSTLTIDKGPYVLNVKRANEFLIKRDLDKIGKPLDKQDWAMTPQTVNAYYDPSMNNINIPAGILQSPFFDANAPAAINYGSIGFVIGHEMTHGFDDQGAQFDAYGNLKNWWTPSDLKKFHTLTQCIVDQYSKYKVAGDLSVQGKLVVGEATADLGGLILAYRAFHDSAAFKTSSIIEGFTPEQQFFLGAAHVWAANVRPEQMQNLVTVDPHPPMIYRVNGTLANVPDFPGVYGLSAVSAMVNQKPCVIW